MGERDLAAPGRPRPAPARVARCAAESGLLGIRIALSQITPAFLPVCERTREGLAQASQVLGPEARAPERLAGRLTAQRQGGRHLALPRAGRFQDRHRQAHGRARRITVG